MEVRKIKLSQAVVDNIFLKQISLMKNATNKVRLIMGIKNVGKGLTCMAQIVDDMRMEEVGFTTEGVPADYKEGEPYFKCIVKAADLLAYLSGFSVFNSDIEMGFDGKLLSLCVKGQADVTLECLAESEAEPLFLNDGDMTTAVLVCSGKTLSDALKMGGFCAEATEDSGAVADRVVLSFVDNTLSVYSTNMGRNKIASCNVQIKTSFNEPIIADVYLTAKTSKISKEDKEILLEKMKGITDEQKVSLAKEEGYAGRELDIAVPTRNIQIIQKLIAGVEKVEAQITTKYLRIRCGNILATFLLAGICPNVYKKVLPKLDSAKWGGVLAVDKEQLVNALNIIQLSPNSDSYPFALSVENGKVTMKDIGGNTARCPIVSSNGDMSDMVKHFKVEHFLSVLSKFPNGNIVISMDSNKNTFMQIRNGALEDKNASVKAYIIEINMDKFREKMAKKDAAKAAKEEAETSEE